MFTLKVKQIAGAEDLDLPSYGHKGDAGLDLRTREDFVLKPGERKMVPTGIMLHIPEGCVGLVWDKSGIAQKRGVKTLGGVIDATYRGEIVVGLINLDTEEQAFERGDKITQMIIQPFEQVDVEVIDDLEETVRGESGWGSTGN